MLESGLTVGDIAADLYEVRRSWVEIGLILSLPELDPEDESGSLKLVLGGEKLMCLKLHVTEYIYRIS